MFAGIVIGPANVLPANMLIRQGATPQPYGGAWALANAAPRVWTGVMSEHPLFESLPLKELTKMFVCARALPATRRPHISTIDPKALMVTSLRLGTRGVNRSATLGSSFFVL